jgi:hypothetical protein
MSEAAITRNISHFSFSLILSRKGRGGKGNYPQAAGKHQVEDNLFMTERVMPEVLSPLFPG